MGQAWAAVDAILWVKMTYVLEAMYYIVPCFMPLCCLQSSKILPLP